VARCDGEAIVWPTPTHGKGRARPWRTAAECIDFSLPCPSIFGRKKPLAENTLKRIGAGLRRFVFEADRPFIVPNMNNNVPKSVDSPLPTVTGGNRNYLVTPVVVEYHGAKRRGDDRALNVERPLPVQDTSNRFGFVVPVLVPRYGERDGQEPRALTVDKPMPTIVPTQNGASLVAGFLAKHYGGHETPGTPLGLPISTLTTQDHHHLVTSHLVSLRGTEPSHLHGDAIDEPLRTISAGGMHSAEVRGRWVASWARALRKPSDLGFADDRFILPALDEVEHLVGTSIVPEGMLMAAPAVGLREQREEQRRTLQERCEYVAQLTADTGEMARTASTSPRARRRTTSASTRS
jgi:DNA (cytosine-5)-methyltransferase 1